jgi:decaprenylphospho-beta-D-erythro-pentofuranosid-2-ulose 2-reductase
MSKIMNIVIVGATSAIATAAARRWAISGNRLVLMGRNAEGMAALASDLTVRGAGGVQVVVEDPSDVEIHPTTVAEVCADLGNVDIVLIAHGSLPDQKATEADTALFLREFTVNALSVMSYASLFANVFEAQKSGCIAVITSVAGDFGRQSNYTYGSAKGAVNLFLQGLRNRLHASGVRVVTIKPGFVDTPMTAHLKKGLLFAKPDAVAARIVALCVSGDGEHYVPGFWRLIMTLLRWIPSSVRIKLKL